MASHSEHLLIYALIDPRTRLIRYVGLSSSGLDRPKDHRYQSCSETYCRQWVKSLQALGLDYEITVLETVSSEEELPITERWWIAYGRACGWPLTNLTDGGEHYKLTEEGQRRLRERLDARELEITRRSGAEFRSRYSPEEIAERQQKLRERCGFPFEIEARCVQFFETHARNHRSVDTLISAVLADVATSRDAALFIYKKWWQAKRPSNVALDY